MSPSIDLSGRVAPVTGGSRGIAEAFLETGAEVAICGRKQPESPPSSGDRVRQPA